MSIELSNHEAVVRLAEYCNLLCRRIEALEERINQETTSNEMCKLYRMNISHKNDETDKVA